MEAATVMKTMKAKRTQAAIKQVRKEAAEAAKRKHPNLSVFSYYSERVGHGVSYQQKVETWKGMSKEDKLTYKRGCKDANERRHFSNLAGTDAQPGPQTMSTK
jgi:hypothetical protein